MKLDYKETKLKNGIRIVTSHMPQVESVAMGIWVGVGGRYESKRVSGISHFIEHLLFKGTESRSARAISEAIEGRGGYFNAFTQEESTCYYARIRADHARNVAEILTDMYRHPKFAKADIDKERGVIIEEIMMYRDLPQQVVQEVLGQLLWSKHPVGRPLIGTPQNIMRMTREDILGFKAKNYLPNNTIVALAGHVDHDVVAGQIDDMLGSVRAGKKPNSPAVTRATKQDRVQVLTKKIEQTHLALGVRVFGKRDPRRYALKILSVILGENMSSRLFQVVREKHGLAYSIHSSVHLFHETGALVISAGLDRKRALKALKLVTSELEKIRSKPVGARLLRRAKDYSIGQLAISLESTTNQMLLLGEQLLGYGSFHQPAETIQKLEKVTAEDVCRVAGQVLRSRKISVAMVTPESDSVAGSDIMDVVGRL